MVRREKGVAYPSLPAEAEVSSLFRFLRNFYGVMKSQVTMGKVRRKGLSGPT
jgi:hypothetical protein